MDQSEYINAIVWFKKDLRLFDHHTTQAASKHTTTLPIYIAEPSIWKYGDLSKRHFQFVYESLIDLQDSLRKIGSDLFVAIDEMEFVLNKLLSAYGKFILYSHREHGLNHTYDRDQRVKKWIEEHDCKWIEFSSFAVARYQHEYPRKEFKEKWLGQTMNPSPKRLNLPSVIPSWLSNDLNSIHKLEVQGEGALNPLKGGEKEAIKKANEFFKHRFKKYNVYINKPFYSVLSSSQLSPYITWGNISLKALHISTQKHIKEIEPSSEFERSQLKAFYDRIQWHCSFVQAIEKDPLLHIVPRDARFDEIRHHDATILEAFKSGKTGIPFVDACMKALNQTGWINFKQRAMLASFACNTLLLDWRDVGHVLAHLWLDYEPGIHWLQMQTQAGLIPEGHIPLYDVIKQSKMHDAEGRFIKQYIPELASVPVNFIHEPWLLDVNPYRPPIIPYRETFDLTKKNLYRIKSSTDIET